MLRKLGLPNVQVTSVPLFVLSQMLLMLPDLAAGSFGGPLHTPRYILCGLGLWAALSLQIAFRGGYPVLEQRAAALIGALCLIIISWNAVVVGYWYVAVVMVLCVFNGIMLAFTAKKSEADVIRPREALQRVLIGFIYILLWFTPTIIFDVIQFQIPSQLLARMRVLFFPIWLATTAAFYWLVTHPTNTVAAPAQSAMPEKVSQPPHILAPPLPPPDISRQRAQLYLHTFANLTRQLENLLDPPVASQILTSAFKKAFNCDLVSVMVFIPEEQRLAPLSTSSQETAFFPMGYRQKISTGPIGHAIHLQKSYLTNQVIAPEDDLLLISGRSYVSSLVVPLFRHGALQFVIVLGDLKEGFFQPEDVALVEAAGAQLLSAQERYRINNNLVQLIQANVTLSAIHHSEQLMQQIAEISRRIMQARFAVVIISGQPEMKIASAGSAQELLISLRQEKQPLLQEALRTPYPFRLRDIRKDPRCTGLILDTPELRTMIACPIQLHGIVIGTILVFGKWNNVSFSEQDTFLLELMAAESSVAVESHLLNQDLRENLSNTQLLYDLSLRIAQAENLNTAARSIVEAAVKIFHANHGGLILFTLQGAVEAEAIFPEGVNHPFDLIKQTVEQVQTIFISENGLTQICFPLQTARRIYGGLWLALPENQMSDRHPTEELRILVNQASVALERAVLLTETQLKTEEISSAYQQLEDTYDQTLVALMTALDARDKETEGHSARVAEIAAHLGLKLNLPDEELKTLERGSLLHDIGKIGISDSILNKRGPLTAEEWTLMREHPEIGARIVQNVPFLQKAIEIITAHQERWDGSGYPNNLYGEQIPLLARIFAVADVFDALTTDRPYHASLTPHQALEYISAQAGIQFDPAIVKILEEIIHQDG